jgi:hypothetical protein
VNSAFISAMSIEVEVKEGWGKGGCATDVTETDKNQTG